MDEMNWVEVVEKRELERNVGPPSWPWVIGPFETESEAQVVADELERHSGNRVIVGPLVPVDEVDEVFEATDSNAMD